LGGGIAASSLKLANSSVLSSSAKTLSGGALGGGVWSNSYVTLTNSSVQDNVAYAKANYSRGGGIYSQGLTSLTDSFVSGNVANGTITTQAGGIYSHGGLTVKYSTVRANQSAYGDAGAAMVVGGDTSIRGSSIYANYARNYFGALQRSSKGASHENIFNSTISGNTAQNGGHAVYIAAYNMTIDNSTIAYNISSSGAGVYIMPGNAGSTLDLNSTLISSNSHNGTQSDFRANVAVAFTVAAAVI
jgi:hypothetical protein